MCVLDGNALLHSFVSVLATFGDFAQAVFNCLPKSKYVHFVTDTHHQHSVKDSERQRRGTSSAYLIGGPSTKMPRDLAKFLQNSQNKCQLLKCILSQWQQSAYADKMSGRTIFFVCEESCVCLPSIESVTVTATEISELRTFAQVCGREDVVCLQNMASFILTDKWHKERMEDVASESRRIVEAAAKLIRAEIREHQYTNAVYPSADDITTSATGEFVPPLLQLHMQTLIGNKLKESSISHAIIQAARPRSVSSPVLFGVGVEVDHVCGSKYIVDELAKLGFSISSYEVNTGRFKQSVMQTQQHEPSNEECYPTRYMQWVADNVDHNVATLDGLGTFHGMGIIAVKARTGNFAPDVAHQNIHRVARMRAKESVKTLAVTIHLFKSPQQKALSMVNLKEIRQLQRPYTLPSDVNLDLLWQSGWMSHSHSQDRPNWSGFMQHVCVGEHPPVWLSLK